MQRSRAYLWLIASVRRLYAKWFGCVVWVCEHFSGRFSRNGKGFKLNMDPDCEPYALCCRFKVKFVKVDQKESKLCLIYATAGADWTDILTAMRSGWRHLHISTRVKTFTQMNAFFFCAARQYTKIYQVKVDNL